MRSTILLNARRWWPLAVALLVALALRVVLWGNIPRQGMVSDEAEYLASAAWLAQGRGFTWHQGWLWTRAPLYPLFVAFHLRFFGLVLTPIYLSQTLLGLLQVILVYALALRLFPFDKQRSWQRWVAGLAALLVGIYFPLAIYNQVLLSETLYIIFLLVFFLIASWWAAFASKSGWLSWALLATMGVLLGLATLTRGLALGFIPIVAAWVWWVMYRDARRETGDNDIRRQGGLSQFGPPFSGALPSSFVFRLSSLTRSPLSVLGAVWLVLSSALVILPWTAYASRQYGGLVVIDTTGAFNLLLGARTAYDGDRKDAPTRNFVLALLDPTMPEKERELYVEQSCLWQKNDSRLYDALNRKPAEITQAQRQQLMTAEGFCLLRERPLAFVQKSFSELIDFFRINYGGDERFTDGFTTGRLHPAYVLATFLLDDTLYVLALPLAVIGWTLARQETGDGRRKTGDGRRQVEEQISCLVSRVSCLVAFWWLYNLLAAPLLFAINRFRVPLMPFLLIFAAYGLLALLHGEWRTLGRRQGAHLVLAALLAYIVVVPASWISRYDPVTKSYGAQESYFGPHPSSVADTTIALEKRPTFWKTESLRTALGAGDAVQANNTLQASDLPTRTLLLGRALLAGLNDDAATGLALLSEQTVLDADDTGWQAQAGVVRGDLLRREGNVSAAKAAFTPRVVDDYNPVEWAWMWLHPSPVPDGRIDLGGNLDIGYIRGFYLGEGDGKDTWRWSSGEATLRFPKAGTGAPQTVRLRIDGASVELPAPQFSVWLGGREVATQPLSPDVKIYEVTLPASAPGADVVVTLRAPVFVPAAADLLAQQGPRVGQLRLLGLRLDWVELVQR